MTMKSSTIALHFGPEARGLGDPVSPSPVVSTSFYNRPGTIGFSANDLAENAPHFYTRWSNPTLEILEAKLAALDQGEAAVTFASGMAAVSALFLDRLKSGDHLILSDVCYAGVAELAHDYLPHHGIEISAVDTSDPAAVRNAVRSNTKHVHVETPANPILRLTDIKAVAEIAHSVGAQLSVDSTIATPLGLNPIRLGADFVVHSLTKYIGGHGDALGGAVIGRSPDIDRLRRGSLIHLGGSLSPFSAWLILRGLETLVPRMQLHQANARVVEEFLASHPSVRSVLWPGSPRHPQHQLAASQMSNFSSLMSFTLKRDSECAAARIADKLKVISYAVSLGKTRSLLFYIPTENIIQSAFHLQGAAAEAYRESAGEGVFRFSVGLEDAEDIIADLDQAL
jgi:cystathionine gamma-synthase/methionine-gamma-lyase